MQTIADYVDSYSDFFKEAHGFRPRHDTSGWSLEDWARVFADLAAICDDNNKAREAAEAAAINAFDKRIAQLIAIGAPDRDTAIRWLHDAEATNGDPEFLCYCLGLPYGHLNPK